MEKGSGPSKEAPEEALQVDEAPAAAGSMGVAPAPLSYLPSQRHAHVAIGAAVGLLAITLVVCYSLWLSQGCLAFLPFVSDLGLHGLMRPAFATGLVGTSLLMFATLPHIVVARRDLVRSLGLSWRWQWANWAVAAAGGAVSLGVALLGFFPWDRALMPHLLCADVIFGGGVAWAVGSCVLASRFARAAEAETWTACPRARRTQRLVAVLCFVDLVVAYGCFVMAYLSDPAVMGEEELLVILRLANDDFGAYCSGRGGWHAVAWINMAALAEWVLIALLVVGVAASAADLEAHCIVQRTMTGRDRPFLQGVPARAES